jgi:hypothetical protein
MYVIMGLTTIDRGEKAGLTIVVLLLLSSEQREAQVE